MGDAHGFDDKDELFDEPAPTPQGPGLGPMLLIGALGCSALLCLIAAAGFAMVGVRSYEAARTAAERAQIEDMERARQRAKARRATAKTSSSSAPAASPSGRRVRRLKGRLMNLDGERLQLPSGEPMVVNVFLERCADCMPAFRSWRDNRERLDLSIPVVNVAYARATPSWLKQYKLDDNVWIDRGQVAVNPHGIRTFTTLVIDAEGRIMLRILPTQKNYVQRVNDAVASVTVSPEAEFK